MAAPHTRGSTPRSPMCVFSWKGCPAHAGIDPSTSYVEMILRGLPRTRGDRPVGAAVATTATVAAPHTRGSTRHRPRKRGRGRGCPAHAGIDPRAATARWTCGWLPRTRGDRPGHDAPQCSHTRAAPHTRGSTRRAERWRDVRRGCPAHAGIDPAARRAPARGRGLPRTRGDRPAPLHDRCGCREAAPHTRGSTRARPRRRRRERGCPAHAGIDPPLNRPPDRDSRLPRTRGDRPRCACGRCVYELAAPHTRGSTHHGVESLRVLSGCPAHAGIDPRVLGSRRTRGRLPRTRGDRPLPRMRFNPGSVAAPHTRGSTRRGSAVQQPRPGCPAHAGIDPQPLATCSASTRLPRTRGDRPSIASPFSIVSAAAPHTRGSVVGHPNPTKSDPRGRARRARRAARHSATSSPRVRVAVHPVAVLRSKPQSPSVRVRPPCKRRGIPELP